MKKHGIFKACMAVCLAFLLAVLPGYQIQAKEVIATVQGTVLSGTTSELLKLSTKEGLMEIKLDSDTDTSSYKLLLPDKIIHVSVSHESDGYLHAVKITGATQTTTTTTTPSNAVTVSGTISEKTTNDVIFFNTAQGEMQIKLDPTTNMSGCSVLVMGKTYYITCVRGSDAYMHAFSISETAAPSNPSNPSPTVPSAPNNAATMSITGTAAESTKDNLLYLSTKGGEMQFVIDANAETSSGMVVTPGNKLTVSYYHGSDGYLHAVGIAGAKNGSTGAQIDTAASVTVTGTVGRESDQNILYLDTKQGRMELKLDAVSSNNCKVLINGKKLTVTCARGSDAYMHALTISG